MSLERVPRLEKSRAYIRDMAEQKLVDRKKYIHRYGEDMPEIRNWKWPY